MTQRKITNEEANALVNYRLWFERICELGFFASDDSHYLHARKMIEHGTTDGKPWVEPDLTDEDAKQRPWVMVSDKKLLPWHGPFILTYVAPPEVDLRFSIVDLKRDFTRWSFRYARRATSEEIEAANVR
jgi:hypothetical protein